MNPSLFIYLFAMAAWGLYWNFLTYGLYNFVSTREKMKDHASSWGVIDIFKGVGLVIAPIIASLAIGDSVGTPLYITAFIFMVIVYFFYLLILKLGGMPAHKDASIKEAKNKPFKVWFLVIKSLFPVFVLNILLCVYDLSFATVGPLVSESLGKTNHLGGAFLTLYYLPTILVLWMVGPVTHKIGKKRTSFIGFIIGGLLTGLMALFGMSLLILVVVLLSSFISSLAWPALKGAFADYISKSPEYEREIEILTDFSGNIGCIIGPILAGFAADYFGNIRALSFIGIACAIIAAIVFFFTPRKLRVNPTN
jgi:Na+/melibiose symporter-like transporter